MMTELQRTRASNQQAVRKVRPSAAVATAVGGLGALYYPIALHINHDLPEKAMRPIAGVQFAALSWALVKGRNMRLPLQMVFSVAAIEALAGKAMLGTSFKKARK